MHATPAQGLQAAVAAGQVPDQAAILAGALALEVRGLRQTQENWSVLILDHHEGYISWAEYEGTWR
jgi:hypothetical protein